MADFDGDQATRERVLAAGGVAKRRRNLSNKTGGDRLRTGQSKSPKRRPGTPEPEKRVFTDESDKEVSDGDYAPSKVHSARGKDRSEIIKRTRSRERPPKKDTTTEIEDDFEIIRQMHMSKKEEEEVNEVKREIRDAIPAVRELREREVKEMPALIEAPRPEEAPKRARPKTLKLKDEVPKVKPRTRSRSRPRRLSTSEEDDEAGLALKGKLTLKPKGEEDVKSELRRRRLLKKKSTESHPDVEKDTKIEDTMETKEEVKIKPESKPWFFKRWFSRNEEEAQPNQPTEDVQPDQNEKVQPEPEPVIEPEPEPDEEMELVDQDLTEEKEEEVLPKRKWLLGQILSEWKEFKIEYEAEYRKIKLLKNRCTSSLLLIVLYCGMGGFIFRFTEGTFESFYKCGVKRVKRDFIDTLWGYSQYMPMEDWKSQARTKLLAFENELHAAHEAGMTSYSGQKSWSFLNAVVYSLTVVTTIGYGHISPATATGRAITIVYAIFGIPMFLILLADFGKLFTRAIKFLWAFVRRVYYTGSCKKVRRTGAVQDMMKGVQFVYDFARRSSQMPGVDPQVNNGQPDNLLKPPEVGISGFPDGTPDTPAISQFEIDDEFNLPISVAITILLAYIFVGASIYCIWEDWSFFESFYFVFISMSTIGFGDYVPHHPIYMMASMVYLVFGLALTSMCINVVQEKLSDTFKHASAKIGATIGIHVVEDENAVPIEICEDNAEANVAVNV